jgi:hypothetical protein
MCDSCPYFFVHISFIFLVARCNYCTAYTFVSFMYIVHVFWGACRAPQSVAYSQFSVYSNTLSHSTLSHSLRLFRSSSLLSASSNTSMLLMQYSHTLALPPSLAWLLLALNMALPLPLHLHLHSSPLHPRPRWLPKLSARPSILWDQVLYTTTRSRLLSSVWCCKWCQQPERVLCSHSIDHGVCCLSEQFNPARISLPVFDYPSMNATHIPVPCFAQSCFSSFLNDLYIPAL